MPSTSCIFTQNSSANLAIKFPSNLEHLHYVGHYSGGSGGVYEVTDGSINYMLKFATSDAHIKQEIFADTIYHRLGINVPAFAVYNEIPI